MGWIHSALEFIGDHTPALCAFILAIGYFAAKQGYWVSDDTPYTWPELASLFALIIALLVIANPQGSSSDGDADSGDGGGDGD